MTMTKLTLAAALIASLAATGAQAERAQDVLTARYDAAANRICLRTKGNGVVQIERTLINGRRCMTEQKWNERGVTFARVSRAQKLAQR